MLRPVVGTILKDETEKTYRRRTTVTAVVETDKHLTIHTKTRTKFSNGKPQDEFNQTQRQQKYLCVNGPLVGIRRLEVEAPDYVVFNRSFRGRTAKDADVPTSVLVHVPTLGV